MLEHDEFERVASTTRTKYIVVINNSSATGYPETMARLVIDQSWLQYYSTELMQCMTNQSM